MKVRIIITFLLFVCSLCFFLFYPQASKAATTVALFQITNDGSQQNSPLIYGNLVAYTNFGGSLGINIWGYDLTTNQNFPIVEKLGQQFLTGLYKNYLTYDDFDASNSAYHVHLYDMVTNQDSAITNSPGTQNDGVTNGKDVVYINGGACGQLEDYNLNSNTTTQLASGACTPLRMAKNIVVWAYGRGAFAYDLDKHTQTTIESLPDAYSQTPNIDANADTAVWMRTNSAGNAIVMEDLHTGVPKVITTSSEGLNYPAVSENFIVWSDAPSNSTGSVKGYNIKTGEFFDVYPLGSQENGNITPAIWGNTAVWSSFRTGNGDIYGATLIK